jgi:serine protease Do
MNTDITSKGRGTRYSLLALAVAATLGLSALSNFSTAQNEAQAQTFAVPQAGASFADVVERVSPAVVNIAVSKTLRSMPTSSLPGMPGSPRGGSPLDEFFGRFFEGQPGQGSPSRPRQSEGQGSGFVIDADGYIVTNRHVIEDAERVVVTFPSGEKLDATVIGQDSRTDLALIKVEADRPLTAVSFGDSDRARVGEWVLAIGNPFGLGGTATAGIISARGRDIQSGPYDDYLQIDAPINSGNSGGPVFNGAGEVVGINTAIFSPNGGNIGIGFAIPANQARSVIADLRANGTVDRGWLGVQIQDIDADLAQTLGLADAKGALVADVVGDGPADEAGLVAGDVIRRFAGLEVESAKALGRMVGETDSGERVDVEVWRDGRARKLEVSLGKLESPERVARSSSGNLNGAELGLALENLTDAHRAQLGLGPNAQGAVVVRVDPDSPAARQGIQPGDLITSVNRKHVESAAAALSELAKTSDRDGKALVLVRRGDSQRFVALGAA